MKCFGDYKDDRTCELCNIINMKEHNECLQKYKEERELNQKLYDIKTNCPYRESCYDEYEEYDGCVKDGYHGRSTKFCNPTLECDNYRNNKR